MREKNNTIFFVIIILILCFMLVSNVERTERTITTQGEASAEYEPDVFRATIGVQRDTANVRDAEREINSIMNNIVAEMESLGVEVKRHDYSINPMYYNVREGEEQAYRVRQTIQVETKDLEKVNNILDTSVNNGANVVQGLRFELSEEKKEEIQTELLEQAIKQARTKAEATARAEGDRVGKVLKLEIGSTGYMPYRMESMDAMAGSASPDIQPGVVEHSARVNVQFELR